MSIRDIFSSLNIHDNGNETVLNPENIPISQKDLVKLCKLCLERKIYEQLKLDLFDDRNTCKGNKFSTFRQFKNTIKQERYFSHLPNINFRKSMTKLRLSARKLPIKNGKI